MHLTAVECTVGMVVVRGIGNVYSPFREYDLNEAWDGPKNSAWRDRRPDFYACPCDPDSQRNRRLTNYFVVEGRNTAFPRSGTASLADVEKTKGRSNTILVVEARGANIEWLEPRDLTFDGLNLTVNDPNLPSISGNHPNGPYAGMAEGSVRSLRGVSPEVLKGMLTVRQNRTRARGMAREINGEGTKPGRRAKSEKKARS